MSESAEDSHLLSVAAAIADGAPVDWEEFRRKAPAEQTTVIDALRLLEGLSRVNENTPDKWGPYPIVGEIGRGAFGIVYHAIDPELQCDIALKVIRPSLESHIDLTRALKEARRLAKSRHPNVVEVYQAQRIGGEVGISMELIDGHTLEDHVQQHGPYSANEAILIGMDLCRALAAVHAAGILHGDIKARNVMREAGGRTVLMDFGAGRDQRDQAQHTDDLTGTPIYLAPEVFAGGACKRTSDIYSLGVLLYFLVSGTYPVTGRTSTEVRRRHTLPQSRTPLRDVRPDLPDGFIRVVDRALSERPEQRHQKASALGAALAEVLPSGLRSADEDGNARARRTFAFAAVAVVAAGLLLGVVMPARFMNLLSNVRSTAGSAAEYRIEAAFYVERDGAETRVQSGTRLAPGDRLHLQVQSSIPLHVYVVNEDEQGESYLLFPLPNQAIANPLPAGQRHRLPGALDGERLSWQVTSAGGREHFLIFANPERSPGVEQLVAALPAPTLNQPVQNARLSAETVGVLRGVGGLASQSAEAGQLYRIAEFSTPLAANEETVTGAWVRQVTIDNSPR